MLITNYLCFVIIAKLNIKFLKNSEKIKKILDFTKIKLETAESGHDFWHSYRVWKMSKFIAKNENIMDTFVLEISAITHDLIDHKFTNNQIDSEKIIIDFFKSLNIEENLIEQVIILINNVSFSKESSFTSKELEILQDADRLDAIGAIGVARAFSYGGYKGREFYNPEIKPNLNMTKAEYKKSKSTTINHFYEKLLTLKAGMNTETAKKIAEKRHNFMLIFLQQFMEEFEIKL